MALGIIGNLMVIISTLTLTLIRNLYIYRVRGLKKVLDDFKNQFVHFHDFLDLRLGL